MWKSRPPGYGALTLIDGHLVTVGPGGVLFVIEATPEGYREKARLPVLSRHTLAAPSFAGGRLESAHDKQRIVVDLLKDHPVPIVEGESRVHFLYHGEAEEVGLSGNMLDVGDQVSLQRVAGTDLHSTAECLRARDAQPSPADGRFRPTSSAHRRPSGSRR